VMWQHLGVFNNNTGKRVLDLLEVLMREPFLKTGVTFANFHKGTASSWAYCFKILGCILSGPGNLDEFRFCSNFKTSYSVNSTLPKVSFGLAQNRFANGRPKTRAKMFFQTNRTQTAEIDHLDFWPLTFDLWPSQWNSSERGKHILPVNLA